MGQKPTKRPTKAIEFVKAVDTFVSVRKTLVSGNSPPAWQRARDTYALRLKLPLEIEGEQRGQHLTIDAYPDHKPKLFTVGLLFADHMIDRVDFDPTVVHANGWHPTLSRVVMGPHWHSWELNRETVTSPGKFFPLPYATEFTQAKEFDAVLRWYAGERNIQVGAHGIEFPAPTRLVP